MIWLTFVLAFIGLTIILLFIVNGQRASSSQNKVMMAVLGSGGHTAEMFTLVKTITEATDSDKIALGEQMIEEIVFVVSLHDQLSIEKLHQLYPQTNIDQQQQKQNGVRYRVEKITRARAVHQSYFSSIFTTLMSLVQAIVIFRRIQPGLVLTNGPGVCIPLIVVARLMSPNSVVIFVESFCRTRTLSLSGKLVYHLRLAHHFLVQWPKLINSYPRANYLGGVLV